MPCSTKLSVTSNSDSTTIWISSKEGITVMSAKLSSEDAQHMMTLYWSSLEILECYVKQSFLPESILLKVTFEPIVLLVGNLNDDNDN